MRAEIDAEAERFPDLLARSADAAARHPRRGARRAAGLGEAARASPTISASAIAGSATSSPRCWRDADDRVTINRRAGELTISFGGDTNQATQFARSVPDFVLKGRFADMVKLDLRALEQEMGFAAGRPAGWWRRLVRR